MHIYSYQLEGGKTPNRDDLREINSLNHYIGMRPLLESDFSEFTLLPLFIGLLMILALRAMVLGKMSSLVDVFVLFVYFGLLDVELLSPTLHVRPQSRPNGIDQSAAFYRRFWGTKTDCELYGKQLSGNWVIRISCLRDPVARGNSFIRKEKQD